MPRPDGSRGASRSLSDLGPAPTASASISVRCSSLGLPGGLATARDLWAHTDVCAFNDSYTAPSVSGHGVVMFEVPSAPWRTAVDFS